MPPEPAPWDRRRSDRNFTPNNNNNNFRWRDQNHPYAPPPPPSPYHRNHQQQQRWYPADFRSSRPATPGHGKQGGGWNMYTDEAGNGYLPFGTRYGDRNNNNNFDNENTSRSPFVSRGGNDGRNPRNSRENRGWRTPSWEPAASPYNTGGRPSVEGNNNRRSVERTQTPYRSEFASPFTARNFERAQTPYNSVGNKVADFSHRSEFASPFTRERTQTPYNGLSNKETDFSHRSDFASPFTRERTQTPYNSLSNKDADFSHRSEFASTFTRERTQTPYNNLSNKETDVSHRSERVSPLPRSLERTQTPHNNVSSKEADTSHRSEFASPLPRSQNPSPPRLILNEQQHKEDGTAEECTSLSQKVEKENEPVSIDWKSLKWNRTGSFSSRSSSLSLSISPKSTGVESVETVAAVQTKSITPLLSTTENAAVCVSAGGSTHMDDLSSRKKPRLGWGQGLAKFEKKKVDGPEDFLMKDGEVSRNDNTETLGLAKFEKKKADGPEDCVMTDGEVARIDNTETSGLAKFEKKVDRPEDHVRKDGEVAMIDISETLLSHAVNVVDKSPTAVCLSDCASPATPSSMACSSSTGVEEKESIKSVNINDDVIKLTCSPVTMCQALYCGPAFNLENLEPSSIANLSTLINEMLHSCCPSSTDSGYMQSSMLKKLSVLKVDISKAIEVAESEIDSLETELKSLIAESGNSPYTASSSPCLEVCHLKSCENQATTSKVDGDELNDCTAELSTVISSQELAISGSTCSDVSDHCSIIWASNKDCADKAMEELHKVLPVNMNQFNISTTASVSLLNGDSLTVKEKFVMRKTFLQLKEKVLSLRFKVFRHFWKEGRELSVRNLRSKSHEKYDLSGHRKPRSIRSRSSFLGGTPLTVSADEVIEVVHNLLSKPLTPYRKTLKMPSLILDKKEMDMSRFPSNNSLIIDPRGVEKERSIINPWTSEETEIFIDNLTTLGKDFKKISSFLEHKTVADCIEFYYKNHKSQLFERAKKKLDSTTQRKPHQSTTYLVGSAKRCNREKNAASLDMLGAASAIAANVDGRTEIQQNCTSRFFLSPSSSSYKSPRGEDSERETVAADVLAGICGSISSEAISSCITSSVDHGEVHHQDWKDRRVCSLKKRKRPLTPEVTQSIDDERSGVRRREMESTRWTDDSGREMEPTRWTDEEISAFVQAVPSYGEDFVLISQAVGTRSTRECKVYFWKTKKRYGWNLIQSETQDACDTETGTVVCKEANDNSKPSIKICELNNQPSEIDDSMATETVICDSTVCLMEMGDKVVSDLNMEDTKQNVENSSCEANKRVSEGNGREGQHLSLTDNLKVEKVEDVNSSEASGVSGTVNEMKSDDLCVSHPYVANSSIQSGGKVSECQKEAYHEQISHDVPLVSSPQLFSVPIKYQTSPPHSALSASLNSNVICYSKRPQNIVEANDSQKNVSVSDSAETLQIFTGHPVSMQTKTQMNGDLNCRRSTPLQNIHKQNGILHSDRFSLQKCNSSDQSRPLSSGASDADRPHGNGDVKLFGKILKASQPKVKFSKEQDDQHGKPGCQSLNVNFNGDCKVNSDFAQSTFDVSSFTGSDNVPVKSCSLWDGNMIQGGLSRLPDSGLLLNTYPSAFGKRALNLDQPSTPNSSNGVTEYQVLRNGATQPFPVDNMNQKQDVLFSEMSRRLGFDVISGLKQQANGMNVVGMGGVSDPVAAIKMHYAGPDQFSLHSGSILKEDSSWRSNGDLGR